MSASKTIEAIVEATKWYSISKVRDWGCSPARLGYYKSNDSNYVLVAVLVRRGNRSEWGYPAAVINLVKRLKAEKKIGRCMLILANEFSGPSLPDASLVVSVKTFDQVMAGGDFPPEKLQKSKIKDFGPFYWIDQEFKECSFTSPVADEEGPLAELDDLVF